VNPQGSVAPPAGSAGGPAAAIARVPARRPWHSR